MRCEPEFHLPIARISTWGAEQKNTENQFIWDLTGYAKESSSCLTSAQHYHILHMSSKSLPQSLELIWISRCSHQQLTWEVVQGRELSIRNTSTVFQLEMGDIQVGGHQHGGLWGVSESFYNPRLHPWQLPKVANMQATPYGLQGGVHI